MEKKDILQNTIVVVFIALICDLLWGSAFPMVKVGYEMFDVKASDTASLIVFAGVRFTLAGILVILFLCIKERRFIFPGTSKSLLRVMCLSLFQTILQYLFFYIGLANTTGVKSSVIEASNVFVALFVSSIVFRQEKLEVRKVIGSLVGFAGVCIINITGFTFDFGFGDLLIFASTFAYAMSSVLLKKFSLEENTVMLSGYQFLFGGIVMVIAGKTFGGNIEKLSVSQLHNMTFEMILLTFYLAFISAAAYSLWSIILSHNPVSKVAVLGFMNPVFGVILSGLILGEGQTAFGLKSALALVFVSLGIIIIYRNKENS